MTSGDAPLTILDDVSFRVEKGMIKAITARVPTDGPVLFVYGGGSLGLFDASGNVLPAASVF